jgi:HEAT repeat protein
MAVTMRQVRAQLDRDEPDYAEAARLGPDAIPHLMQLVQGTDAMLASKAAYLASLIQSANTVDVLEIAANSPYAQVRVSAAAGISNLAQPPATPLLDRLLKDQDVGVRQYALRSIEVHQPAGIRKQVQEIARNDPDIDLQQLADRVANQLP